MKILVKKQLWNPNFTSDFTVQLLMNLVDKYPLG